MEKETTTKNPIKPRGSEVVSFTYFSSISVSDPPPTLRLEAGASSDLGVFAER
ncbi:hypothetical protein GS458_1936 [Geobacillus stearothermophilus]|nr:hypothetical protein GARCT_02121 [Geobacillus sp. 12AMOR1]ATA60377.1 hypothetical protein GS458_1936 [Geobacillus stearothermophilus]STO12524.1 Uncharacterised protein [[Flavobacterium] thermophilum]